MDSFFVKALGLELKSHLTGARIGKPWLADPFRLILPLAHEGKRFNLYFSAHPFLPTLYLTDQRPGRTGNISEQVEMLFQKYLTQAVITEVQMVEMERILILHLFRDTRYHDLPVDYPDLRLIFEIMGRNANGLLTSDRMEILAALRYVPPCRNRHRSILLGETYRLPPSSKLAPLTLSRESFLSLQNSTEGAVDQEKIFHQRIGGLDLSVVREIFFRAEARKKAREGEDALWGAFCEVLQIYRQAAFSPRIISPQEGTELLCAFPLQQFTAERLPDRVFSSPSGAAGEFEQMQLERKATESLRHLLIQKIRSNLAKAETRLSSLKADLKKAEQAEEYRQMGDLIMAHLPQIKRGLNQLEAENFYSSEPQAPLAIPLDPLLTPVQNAQRYYKKYTKAKSSGPAIRERLKSTGEEISFLATMEGRVAGDAARPALETCQALLQEKGIIESKKENNSSSARASQGLSGRDIRWYVSCDGLEMLVGKNDRGNDALTCKIARKHDLWFHAQDVPGSHVLVRNPERLEQIPFPTIRQAASLAAYFSRARNDTRVMVDYTPVRYVTKPKGAKPGLVIVHQKKSILVPPGLPDVR